jgi:hypothetical protein
VWGPSPSGRGPPYDSSEVPERGRTRPVNRRSRGVRKTLPISAAAPGICSEALEAPRPRGPVVAPAAAGSSLPGCSNGGAVLINLVSLCMVLPRSRSVARAPAPSDSLDARHPERTSEVPSGDADPSSRANLAGSHPPAPGLHGRPRGRGVACADGGQSSLGDAPFAPDRSV